MAVSKVENRKRFAVRAPSDHALIMTCGKTHHLQANIKLIRPEPGHTVVGFIFSCQHRRRCARLIDCVGDTFQALRVVKKKIAVTCAVADCQNGRIVSPYILINENAIVAGDEKALESVLN